MGILHFIILFVFVFVFYLLLFINDMIKLIVDSGYVIQLWKSFN